MTVDSIMDRAMTREAGLWTPSLHCFIGAMDTDRRVVLIGLYANGFINGFAYLTELSTEKLQQFVDQYEANMLQLSLEEQKLTLDIAAKRYLDVLEQQIHDQKMITRRAEIDAQSEEYDAKMKALEADRTALLTMQEKTSQAAKKAEADIAILTAKIAEETINRNYVEVDILEKELSVKRTNLQIIEAGVKGLDIKLDIQNAAIQLTELKSEKHSVQQQIDLIPGEIAEAKAEITNISANITKVATDNALLDADVAEMEDRIERTRLDAVNREVDTALLDVDIARAKLDSAMVDVDTNELKAKTAREKARQSELQTDISAVDIQIAELQLDADKVDVDLKELEGDIVMIDARILQERLIDIDKRIMELKKEVTAYEIPAKKQAQITAIQNQIEIISARLSAINVYKEIENNMHTSKETKLNAEHSYRLAMAELDKELDIHRAEVKIESSNMEVTIAEKQDEYQDLEDLEQNKIPASQINVAFASKQAAIEAANTMATANIVNTLTHQIGAVS